MTEFRFAEMSWLHATWAILLLAGVLVLFELRGRSLLDRMVSPWMQRQLVARTPLFRRLAAIGLLTMSLLFLVGALMRPQWGMTVQRLARIDSQIMICLDVSKSMLAEDVVPNRLERAKAEIDSLLSLMDDGQQVGLIAFAGKATVLCPMTTDFSFLRLILAEATPDTVGMGGTRIGEAIEKATEGFRSTGDVNRMVLLITDGEDHDSFPLDAAEKARERGVKIVSVGFGDEAGSKIEITDSVTGARRFLQDRTGQDVISRLDGETLREIALNTEGAYIPAGTGALDLQSIYDAHIKTLLSGSDAEETRVLRNEGYQWFVLASLGFFFASLLMRQSFAAARQSVADPSRANPVVAKPPQGSVAGASRANRSIVNRVAIFLLAGLTVIASNPTRTRAQVQPTSNTSSDLSESSAISSSTATMGASETEDLETNGANTKDSQELGSNMSEPRTADNNTPELQEREQPPRVLYNRAVRLISTDYDRAEKLLTTARNEAGSDGELRYRSLYNLGWVEVNRADSLMEAEPSEALKHLELAAGRFGEAVRLRPDSDEARANLEVISQRILELRDRLAQSSEQTIEDELDRLIEAERAHLSELQTLAISVPSSGELSTYRSSLRKLGVTQRRIISDGEKLADTIRSELASIRRELEVQQVDASQPGSEQDEVLKARLREAQLTAGLPLLERAIQRLQKSRSFTRRSQVAAAFGRWASGLSDSKRARDQLRNPVEILGVLIPDIMEVARNTQMLMMESTQRREEGSSNSEQDGSMNPKAAEATSTIGHTAPAWLTDDYIRESQDAVTQRTRELRIMLDGIVESSVSKRAQADAAQEDTAQEDTAQKDTAQANNEDPAVTDFSNDESMSSEEQTLLANIQSALPSIAEAVEQFERASELLQIGLPQTTNSNARLTSQTLQDVTEAQSIAIEELMSAAEKFFDLRRLIEVMHRDQQVALNLTQGLAELAEQNSNTVAAEVAEQSLAASSRFLPTLLDAEIKNLKRTERLEQLLRAESDRIAQREQEVSNNQAFSDQASKDQTSNESASALSELEQERQRLESADALLDQAIENMAVAIEKLRATPSQNGLNFEERSLEPTDERRPPSPKTTRPRQDATSSDVTPANLVTDGENAVVTEYPVEEVQQAAEAIEELRRLFFSIIEHLRDTAQRQAELNDATSREMTEAGERLSVEASRLASRQSTLESTSRQIAEALKQQSSQTPTEEPVPPAPGVSGSDVGNSNSSSSVQQDAQALEAASDLVLEGANAMKQAQRTLSDLAAMELPTAARNLPTENSSVPRPMNTDRAMQDIEDSDNVGSGEIKSNSEDTSSSDSKRSSLTTETGELQLKALQKLIEALQLLDDQQSQQNQDPNQGQSNEQQSSDADQNNSQDGQDGSQSQSAEQSQEQRNMNAEQMLQAIRDREAERRKEKASRQAASQTTVEKDW